MDIDLSQASVGRAIAGSLVLQWVVHTEARPYRLSQFSIATHGDSLLLSTTHGEGWDGVESDEFAAEVLLTPKPTGLTCRLLARHPEGVRVAKTVVQGLPAGVLRTCGGDGHHRVGARHRSFEYPGAWSTPMVWLEADAPHDRFVARTVAEPVARRAYSARLRPSGDTELILYEEAHAASYSRELRGGTWSLAFVPSLVGELSAHGDELGRAWRLAPTEQRLDAGPWAKQCNLVVRLSGIDFNGLVHLDFHDMTRAIEFLSRYGDLSHTLFHVVGWDGAYMRDCPNLRPAPQLGGDDGLRHLVDAAHAVGARVILHTNPTAASEQRADQEHLRHFQSCGFDGGLVGYPARDWDSDGFAETGWLLLNLSFADYRNWLVAHCEELVDRHGVDGFFLGDTDLYTSDRRGDPYLGWRALVSELRDLGDDIVLVGEGSADYVTCLTPVFQPHSRADSAEFQLTVGRWGRSIAYSAMADSQHRAGVGELVHAQYRPLKGVSRNVVPAVSVARKTMETNKEYLLAGLHWASTWQSLYGVAAEPVLTGAGAAARR
ncbi:MAG: alpha-amylase family protein [Anaerolineae bacterium]